MSVAKVSEIIASSDKSFDDAVAKGVKRASKTLKKVKSAWVEGQQVGVQDVHVVRGDGEDLEPLALKRARRFLADTGEQGRRDVGVPGGDHPFSCQLWKPRHPHEQRHLLAEVPASRVRADPHGRRNLGPPLESRVMVAPDRDHRLGAAAVGVCQDGGAVSLSSAPSDRPWRRRRS